MVNAKSKEIVSKKDFIRYNKGMSKQKSLYYFNTDEKPSLAAVGGKALSLVKMTSAGFPVPGGAVLTVDFFFPWFLEVEALSAFGKIRAAGIEALKPFCDEVKKFCLELTFSGEQQQILKEASDTLRKSYGAALFAVRSSSPEEDLEGASFAGGYETSLGISAENLEAAVRHSFASAYDERIFVYKKEQGFSVEHPRIAVIIQKQLDSRVSGVGFSLNPLNNCYDEAVINANFGLGETVVSGTVTPDTYIVDKIKRTILTSRPGKKESILRLEATGGTTETQSGGNRVHSLNNNEILNVTDVISKVEARYGKPMDIEWAYEGTELYLLQARPITSYYPLPDFLITKPGEPKKLYQDKSLTHQGMMKAISVMGADYLYRSDLILAEKLIGLKVSREEGKEMTYVNGRWYLNVAFTMHFRGKRQLIRQMQQLDTGAAEIFANTDFSPLLEVGGMLQHGALVAREYGKTCVAGIGNATSILVDGQEVEIDGASGIVRILS